MAKSDDVSDLDLVSNFPTRSVCSRSHGFVLGLALEIRSKYYYHHLVSGVVITHLTRPAIRLQNKDWLLPVAITVTSLIHAEPRPSSDRTDDGAMYLITAADRRHFGVIGKLCEIATCRLNSNRSKIGKA